MIGCMIFFLLFSNSSHARRPSEQRANIRRKRKKNQTAWQLWHFDATTPLLIESQTHFVFSQPNMYVPKTPPTLTTASKFLLFVLFVFLIVALFHFSRRRSRPGLPLFFYHLGSPLTTTTAATLGIGRREGKKKGGRRSGVGWGGWGGAIFN